MTGLEAESNYGVSLPHSIGNKRIAIISERKVIAGPGNLITASVSPRYVAVQEEGHLDILSISRGSTIELDRLFAEIPPLMELLAERFGETFSLP